MGIVAPIRRMAVLVKDVGQRDGHNAEITTATQPAHRGQGLHGSRTGTRTRQPDCA